MFSSLLIGDMSISSGALFFKRQGLLYAAFALTFVVLLFIDKSCFKNKRILLNPAKSVFVGIIGAVATFLCVYTSATGGFLYYAATVLLGVSEAVLMSYWFHLQMRIVKDRQTTVLGFDIIAGGAIALLIQSLVGPVNVIVACCLPLLGALSLVLYNTRYNSEVLRMLDEDRSAELLSNKEAKHTIVTSSLYKILPTLLYAFVFGMVQGGFLVINTAVLIADSPFVFLGMILAGCVIFFTLSKRDLVSGTNIAQRLSMVLFICGVVIFSLIGAGGGQLFSALKILFIIAEIAIFAGFNLFDFGSIIQELAVVKTYGMGFSFYVSLFRALVYLSLLVGLLIGTAIVLYFPESGSEQALFLICGCGILVLAASVMIPVHVSEESLIKMNASSDNTEDNQQSSGNQNIAEGASVKGATGAALDNATKEDSQREGLPCEGCGLKNKPECTLVKAIQSKSEEGQTASGAEEDLDGIGEKQNRTPWRVACKNMVKVYGLSPREEEIFFLIAKGRNAEYVQQKLVISIHTAKTHIANIYRKLDVHSSQEMLTLIEVFRDAPK